MYKNLYARLKTIAEEDNDREDEIGHRCPSKLSFALAGGHIVPSCSLVDGLNSLDDRTIDVELDGEPNPEGAGVWIVQIEHIVTMRLRYPLQAEIEAAQAVARSKREVAAA